MYNVDELYKALQAGADPDNMVRQFTSAMNAARPRTISFFMILFPVS